MLALSVTVAPGLASASMNVSQGGEQKCQSQYKWKNGRWHYTFTCKEQQSQLNKEPEFVWPNMEQKPEQKPEQLTPPSQPVVKPQQPEGNNVQQSTVGNAYELEVVQLTNAERVKAGLAPFTMDEKLMAAAREKSADMQTNRYFSHTSPTFGSPFERMKALGISYKSAGENIAQGQRSPQEVVQAWMDSPGHRANILNSTYTHIGVGYIEQGNYWTQQFIQK